MLPLFPLVTSFLPGPRRISTRNEMIGSSAHPLSSRSPRYRQQLAVRRKPAASAVGRLVPVLGRGHVRRVLIDALGILAGLAVLLLAVFLEALLEGVDALSHVAHQLRNLAAAAEQEIGRASCRERVCQYV